MTRRALSSAQSAIWFEEQLQTSSSNTGCFSVTLTGDVSEADVRAACAAVVARHEPLNAVVDAADPNHPALVPLGDDQPAAFGTVYAPCAVGTEAATTRAWRYENGQRRFDVTREPGIAFTLLRHDPYRRTLLVIVHHLCFDGRSKFIFAREFNAALAALRRGQPPELAPAPYPSWPNADDAVSAEAVAAWNDLDLAACPPMRIPLSGLSRNAPSGSSDDVVIDGVTRELLVAIAAAHRISLFGGLLAVLAMQLAGYGNDQVVLNVPADVSTPGSRGSIGLAVNVVPVLLRLSGPATLSSMLGRARAALDHVKRFRRVPFRTLGSGVALARRAPMLFGQLSIVYLPLPSELPPVPGLGAVWDFVAPNSASTFRAMLQFRDGGDRLRLRLDHSGHGLDDPAATAVLHQYAELVRRVVRSPDAPVGSLGVIPRDSVLAVRRPAAGPARPALVELCGDHAARHPSRPAIVGPDGEVTYAELLGGTGRTSGPPDSAGGLLALVGGASPLPYGFRPAAVRWQAGRLAASGAGARILSLAPAGSLWFWQECLLAWAAGGTLVLTGEADQPDLSRVTKLVAVHRPTVLLAPYRVLRAVLAGGARLSDAGTPLAQLRPSAAVAARLAEGTRLHGVLLYEGVGTVGMTTVGAAALAAEDAPVLRDPAPGVRLQIVGSDGQVVPRGVTGAITADGTVTGDLGWIDRAAALHVSGHAHDTVYWGGSEMVLTDIERSLVAYPEVADAAVTVEDHRPVAYVVPFPGRDIDLRGLRRHVRARRSRDDIRLARTIVVPELPAGADGTADPDNGLAGEGQEGSA